MGITRSDYVRQCIQIFEKTSVFLVLKKRIIFLCQKCGHTESSCYYLNIGISIWC